MKKLLAAFAVWSAAAVLTTQTLALATPGREVLAYSGGISVDSLLASTNEARGANGVAGLALNARLEDAAQAKANDMVAENYWSHYSPNGSSPWTFIAAAGYQYQAAGENLAYGFDTATNTITAWLNSPEHRANLLNGRYRDVGFGIAASADFVGTGPETIVVAEYGQPVAAAPPPAPARVPAPALPAAAAAAAAPAPARAAVPAAAAPPSPTQHAVPRAMEPQKPRRAPAAKPHRTWLQTIRQATSRRLQAFAARSGNSWSLPAAVGRLLSVMAAVATGLGVLPRP